MTNCEIGAGSAGPKNPGESAAGAAARFVFSIILFVITNPILPSCPVYRAALFHFRTNIHSHVSSGRELRDMFSGPTKPPRIQVVGHAIEYRNAIN